jgi:lysophospholipase L1-like esterase
MKKLHLVKKLAIVSLLATIVGCGGGSDENEIRYVAMGARDATGIGANPPSDGYVFKIEDGLEASTGKNVSLINLGIPGATADIIEEVELPIAKNSKPDLVTIFMGGNDINDGVSAESFANEVRSVVESMVNDTDAIVVIVNLPDVSKLPRFVESPDTDVTTAKVAAYNQVISDIAVEFNIPVVDLSSEPIEDYLISSDGFHPNNQGYQKIADKFLEIIIPIFGTGTN